MPKSQLCLKEPEHRKSNEKGLKSFKPEGGDGDVEGEGVLEWLAGNGLRMFVGISLF